MILTQLERHMYEPEFKAWKYSKHRKPLKYPSVPYEVRRARAVAAYEGKQLPGLGLPQEIDLWYQQIKQRENK